MDCYVCGASEAKWSIRSSPSAEGEPYFPFLEYHKPPPRSSCSRSRDNEGDYMVCYVCYSFLLQQWSSYQENGTPSLKRLYWMRHSSSTSSGKGHDNDSSFSNQSGMLHDEKLDIQSFETSSLHLASFKSTYMGESSASSSLEGPLDTTSCKANPVASDPHNNSRRNLEHVNPFDRSLEKESSASEKIADQQACPVCGNLKTLSQMQKIHTRPQLKHETPFYPSILNRLPEANHLIDTQGRILICNNCCKVLLHQWKLFTQMGTPFAERKYLVNSKLISEIEMKTFVCFLCAKDERGKPCRLSCVKKLDGEPFYPFLKNLREPPGSCEISKDGIVECCVSCAETLHGQWLSFKTAHVSECDHIYSIAGINQSLLGPPKETVEPVLGEKKFICLVCHVSVTRNQMKEVYSNPYANMDLSFLEELDRVSGSYFSRKTGQTLICKDCYTSISCQWKKYNEENVPLDVRRYQLQRQHNEQEPVKCEICKTVVKSINCHSARVVPNEEDHNEPFFPVLADLVRGKRSKLVPTCKFCYANLFAQWKHFERTLTEGDQLLRTYKPYHFVCFLCGSTAHYSDLKIISKTVIMPLLPTAYKKPTLAVEVDYKVAVCLPCNETLHASKSDVGSSETVQEVVKIDSVAVREKSDSRKSEESSDTKSDEGALKSLTSLSKNPQESPGMKVTATVPPLPNLVQRNQDHSTMQNQSSVSRNDDEGSFAAALRKLAQQAIVPTGRRPSTRERQGSPSAASHNSGSSTREANGSPTPTSSSSNQPHSPFYLRGNAHHANINTSSIASIIPPSSVLDKDKPDLHGKHTFGSSQSSEELTSRRISRPVIPGIFSRHEAAESIYRQAREDEAMHHGEQSSLRDHVDATSRSHAINSIVNGPGGPGGPGGGPLNIHGVKDRGSNIGLVHPQPVRKLPDEDAAKSGLLSGVRLNPAEGPASLFRPPSPSESFSRYPLMHSLHQHGSQGSCPVHGHETGHHHGSPRDHPARSGRIPFEGIAPRAGPLSDMRGIHSHHQRMRDEIYGINRVPLERRDGLSSHILEEDLRRRGFEWGWPMHHPVFENDQYRRHMVNGYRGSEQAFKDIGHGPHYFSPHVYYPPEFPLHMDPYAHTSYPHADVYSHRYNPNQRSPRMMDIYRRDRTLSDRACERGETRRNEQTIDKLVERSIEKRGLEVMETEHSIPDERDSRRQEINEYLRFSADRTNSASCSKDDRNDRPYINNAASISSMAQRSSCDNEEPRRKLRIMEKLDLIAKSSQERGCKLEDILIKEEPGSTREPGFSVESVSDELETREEHIRAESMDAPEHGLMMEQSPEKVDFMSSIGLISHGKRRALEDDYDRKRWERKLAKLRGKPRKRRKREYTEDSDGRPCSELDFYNGPMTRHKQQLLQEQEMLLEQVQKTYGHRNESKENEDESNGKNFSISASSSPTNSSVTSTTPNSVLDQPSRSSTLDNQQSFDERLVDFGAKTKPFSTYGDRGHRKDFASDENVGNKIYTKHDEESQLVRDSQEFDSYVHGRRQTEDNDSSFKWSGIDNVARAYEAYHSERDVKENMARKSCERRRSDAEKLNRQRQQLQKEIMVLREKRGQCSENHFRLQNIAKNLHQALAKFSAM